MSEKTLKQLVGALAAAGLLWLAVFLLTGRSADGGEGATGEIAAFFEGASDSTLTAVRFVRPEDTIELRRVDDSWMVNGFRSDSGSIARFFGTLADAEIGGLAATNPANHGRMGVSVDSARTLELELGGATRALLVGKEGPRVTTAYVRLPTQDTVYLLEGGIRSYVFRQLDDWRNRRMLVIDTTRVTRLAIERDGDSFTLVRADSAWTFADGGAVNATQVRSILTELGGGLVASRFVAETDSIAALPPGGSTVAYSESGELLAAVTVGSGSGDRWATAAGDSVLYRLPSFRVNLIVPTLESVRPGG